MTAIDPELVSATDPYMLSNGQAPLYLLARGGIMPTCLALTVLMEQTIPSRRTIFYSISANLSLLIAICASVFDIIWDTLFAGIVSTVFAVLFPILLLQKYNELDHYLSSQQIVSVNLSPADDANGHRRADGPKRLAFCWGYLSSQKQEGTTTPARHGRSLWVPVRNAIATFLLTISLVYTFLQPPSITDFIRPTLLTSALPKNPHAKWISRPLKSVAVTDGYLGARPHVDTVADLPLLARTCRDFYSVTERNHDGLKCLIYLATTEAEYYSLPEEGRMLRASEQDPAKAEYADADGYGNSLASYPSPSVATPASKDTIGTCSGPIIPYHSYWIGRASWRVELYVKSYLYTQNLPCSRLWLWLDLDRHPHALRDFREDPAFKLFAPLIARGDIILKGWRFPSQIPLPSNPSKTNPKTFYERPVPLKNDGLLKVADEVTQDAEGQLWLKYNPRFRPFLNDYMSDTARFTILHLHGGLWCDIDILLLRDLRPLVLPHPIHGRLAFGEQWVERSHIADYNSAVLSIMANSSFSTFLLHGGVRMGMNFCPKVLGRMIWKENRTQEFPMLDTAAFDPSTPTINRSKGRKCSVPCHESYSDVFVGRPGVVENEWRDYESTPLKEIASGSKPNTTNPEAFSPIEIIQQFRYEHGEDLYPPNNRSMQNFFRGAWGYHIHNQ
ncbi:MAG: hypothetical protein MMC33_007390, partial [Icmadophila ericetorum]|nr:hypothetical protein [Icmadophila ericetorum]